jgi:hypothetical protein
MPQNDLLALRAFIYAFPTESPPILGQQVTLTDNNRIAAASRLDLLIERGRVDAPIPDCDLVVTGVIGGARRGFIMDRNGLFQPDRSVDPVLDRNSLEALVSDPADTLTFLCTPWGSGVRIGIDRDLDGILNADE